MRADDNGNNNDESMRSVTKLVIPNIFDRYLTSHIRNCQSFTEEREILCYIKRQVNNAYNLGVEAGKLAALVELRKEIGGYDET